jgi:CheY-like chemotaxis protein
MRKATVLVIDDSDLVLDATRITLEGAGFHVVTLDNPLLMAASILQHQPVLVLLDINMPLTSGDDLAKLLLQAGMVKRTHILLHSDMPVEQLAAKAKASGVSGYVQKTSDPWKFLTEVIPWTRQKGAGPP